MTTTEVTMKPSDRKQKTALWHSHNATPDDRSGAATFQIGDSVTCEMELACFLDYSDICALMDAARNLGFDDAKETIREKIRRLTL